jgi:hypothetical protein
MRSGILIFDFRFWISRASAASDPQAIGEFARAARNLEL